MKIYVNKALKSIDPQQKIIYVDMELSEEVATNLYYDLVAALGLSGSTEKLLEKLGDKLFNANKKED